jgi:hypothetical protein
MLCDGKARIDESSVGERQHSQSFGRRLGIRSNRVVRGQAYASDVLGKCRNARFQPFYPGRKVLELLLRTDRNFDRPVLKRLPATLVERLIIRFREPLNEMFHRWRERLPGLC